MPVAACLSESVIRSELLGELTGVIHGLTRRLPGLGLAEGNVGYSAPRDQADAWEMRRQWSEAIGVDPDSLTTAGQVHGNNVLRVAAADAGLGARPGSGRVGLGDALITAERGITVMTLHADCAPVLIVDPRTPAVAVVHAGWRGTVGDVVGATVDAMRAAYGSRPGDLLAYIGPSIRGCCYQVGADVAAAWMKRAGTEAAAALRGSSNRFVFDPAAANQLLLERAGVRRARIETSAVCTQCQAAEWFSHRAQGPHTGRFGAVIALASH